MEPISRGDFPGGGGGGLVTCLALTGNGGDNAKQGLRGKANDSFSLNHEELQ